MRKYKPRVIITTSHRPSQRLRSFAKDLAQVIPFSLKVNRGKSSFRDLAYDALSMGAEKIVVVSAWKGNPGSIHVYEPLSAPEPGLREVGYFRLRAAILRREIPGSAKLSFVDRAGVSIEDLPPSLQYLADTFSRLFFYGIVFGREDYNKFSVIAKPFLQGEYIIVEYVCPSLNNRPCGPRLKIIRVEDYVSGFRFYRARAWIEKTSREPG